MTPIERAARVLHKCYIEERIRNGVKPSDLPAWDDLGVDGRYYFTAPVRAVLTEIREPSEHAMGCGAYRLPGIDAATKQAKARDVYRAMIDAMLEEGPPT